MQHCYTTQETSTQSGLSRHTYIMYILVQHQRPNVSHQYESAMCSEKSYNLNLQKDSNIPSVPGTDDVQLSEDTLHLEGYNLVCTSPDHIWTDRVVQRS